MNTLNVSGNTQKVVLVLLLSLSIQVFGYSQMLEYKKPYYSVHPFLSIQVSFSEELTCFLYVNKPLYGILQGYFDYEKTKSGYVIDLKGYTDSEIDLFRWNNKCDTKLVVDVKDEGSITITNIANGTSLDFVVNESSAPDISRMRKGYLVQYSRVNSNGETTDIEFQNDTSPSIIYYDTDSLLLVEKNDRAKIVIYSRTRNSIGFENFNNVGKYYFYRDIVEVADNLKDTIILKYFISNNVPCFFELNNLYGIENIQTETREEKLDTIVLQFLLE